MSAVKIECYPNNEIRVTFLPLYRSSRPSPEKEGLFHDQVEVVTISGSDEDPERSHNDFDLEGMPLSPSLDITSELETSTPKPGYGGQARKTSFGAVGRRTLIRAGAALTKSITDPREVVFLTGTLPGSTQESFSAIARYSSYVVHRLKAWVAKRCPSKMDMYCWEWQRRGALHLHYAVHCPDEQSRKYIIEGFKSQWIRLIDSISEKSGFDCWRKDESYTHAINKEIVQADARECEKDIGRYLSKYISKKPGKQSDMQFYPTRWWGVSRPLNALLKSLSEVVMIPLSSERKYRRLREDISQFVDTNEVTVQRYSVEQFADVAICYSKSDEHEGLWTELKRRIMQICPRAQNLFTPGSTEKEKMRLETENLCNSVRQVFVLVQNSNKLLTSLYAVASSQELEVLNSIIVFRSVNPRDALVISVRLLSALARVQYQPPRYTPHAKILEIFDERFVKLIKCFPKGTPIPDRLTGQYYGDISDNQGN